MTKIKSIKNFANQVLNMEGMEIGVPLVQEGISFVPIIKNEPPRAERDYLTLSEALEENLCNIIDKGTEVAHIVFENLGNSPILIEEGEIFQGEGTQNRISIGTVMVEPHSQIEISVKCVHAPHHLSSGANFYYGGKCSREMLSSLRTMKYSNAVMSAPASTISQGRVWDQVNKELTMEDSAKDKSDYMQGIKARRKRVKKISKSLEFPENTVGFVVLDPKGELKGLEVHHSPHNFKIRKDGILESLENNLSWKSEDKTPYKEPKVATKKIFKTLSNLKEGEDAVNQVEIEGMVINMDGLTGEAYSTTFYSGHCPDCGETKPKIKACPHCGAFEDDDDRLAYLSL